MMSLFSRLPISLFWRVTRLLKYWECILLWMLFLSLFLGSLFYVYWGSAAPYVNSFEYLLWLVELHLLLLYLYILLILLDLLILPIYRNVHTIWVLQKYLNRVLNDVLYLVLVESWEIAIRSLLLQLLLLLIILLIIQLHIGALFVDNPVLL